MQEPSKTHMMGSMLFLLLPWKLCSLLYSTYTTSEAVTPTSAGPVLRGVVLSFFAALTMLVQILPLGEYPIINFLNTLFSIHSQIHSLYVALKQSSLSETHLKFAIVFYLVSVLSITQTLYQLIRDWEQIDTRAIL